MRQCPTILVIDDHPPTAKSLQKLLKVRNPTWEVLIETSLKGGLDAIKKWKFDAIVTDWKLNDRDTRENGFILIGEARKTDPLCVCILITAFPEEFKRYEDAFPTGIYDCILKTQRGVAPGEEIAVKLRLALEKRWAHEEAYFYARHIDHTLRGTLGATSKHSKLNSRWLTIAFTDIRGFSRVSDQLRANNPPVVKFLQELYTKIVETSHRHSGIVDKFIGDGSMLLFGLFDDDASEKNVNHARNAGRAAWELQQVCLPLINAFREEAATWHTGKIGELSLGIGINTQNVQVGIIQTQHRDHFTALEEYEKEKSDCDNVGKPGERKG